MREQYRSTTDCLRTSEGGAATTRYWEDLMATYDPPQPMWKRSVASVLDFVLALVGFGYVVSKIFGVKSEVPDIHGELVTTFEPGKGPAT
jgi:hypothetical protein